MDYDHWNVLREAWSHSKKERTRGYCAALKVITVEQHMGTWLQGTSKAMLAHAGDSQYESAIYTWKQAWQLLNLRHHGNDDYLPDSYKVDPFGGEADGKMRGGRLPLVRSET